MILMLINQKIKKIKKNNNKKEKNKINKTKNNNLVSMS